MAPVERASWHNHWEFLLTSLGMAVGLGNVWRFPYITYTSGGGSFLVPYFLALLIIGWPLMFQEIAVGQYARAGCNKVFPRMAPIFKGLAYAIVYSRVFGQVYFAVITSWSVFYLCAGFQSDLPWTTCTEDWNTRDCYNIDYNENCENDEVFWDFTCSSKDVYCVAHDYSAWDSASDSCVSTTNNETFSTVLGTFSISPAEDYFNGKVLGVTKDADGTQYTWNDYGTIRWELVLCQLLIWILVSLVNIKGIKSLGKAAYVLTLLPYVLLTILLGYSITLPGAEDGVEYYMSPDWSKLSDQYIWLQACVQIVMSTGVACGSHMVLASFNPKNNNVLADSIFISFCNSLTSIYAGFAVFCMTGFLAHETGSSVDNAVAGGVSLAFVSYPSAMAEMPVSQLWSFLFFLTLINLALSGLTASNQVIISFVTDEWPMLQSHQEKISLGASLLCFVCGIPFAFNGGIHLFTLIDSRGTISGLALAMLQCIVISWFYGMDNFSADLVSMSVPLPRWLRWVWTGLFVVIIPAALAYMYIYSLVDIVPMSYRGYEYPDVAEAFGWFFIILPLVFVGIYAVWFVLHAKMTGLSWGELARAAFQTEVWGRLGEKVAHTRKGEIEESLTVHRDSTRKI